MKKEWQTEMAELKGIFLQFSVANKPMKPTTEKYVKMQTRCDSMVSFHEQLDQLSTHRAQLLYGQDSISLCDDSC
jgi:hypothetical protein